MKISKIIINGRFLSQRTTGVQRYAREILNELDKIAKPHEFSIAVSPDAKDIPDYKNIDVIRIGKLHGTLWEQISFSLFALKRKLLTLNLCNSAPLINPGIVAIHDVKIKAYPEFFSKKFRIWYNILFKNETKRAKAIITVSEFSKSEIRKYYYVPNKNIYVIPNAWQHYERIGYDENTLAKYGLEKGQYYFAMSSLEPNKNFKWIAEVATKNTDQVFAIAGSINDKIFSKGLGFECPPNMKLLGYVSDEEGKTLMRDSKAFLFPSFYEGFGIPPLEALSAGCKLIIVSDIPVMHEIFENKAIYITPTKVDLPSDLESIKEKDGNEILSKYSWKQSAIQFYNIKEKKYY